MAQLLAGRAQSIYCQRAGPADRSIWAEHSMGPHSDATSREVPTSPGHPHKGLGGHSSWVQAKWRSQCETPGPWHTRGLYAPALENTYPNLGGQEGRGRELSSTTPEGPHHQTRKAFSNDHKRMTSGWSNDEQHSYLWIHTQKNTK